MTAVAAYVVLVVVLPALLLGHQGHAPTRPRMPFPALSFAARRPRRRSGPLGASGALPGRLRAVYGFPL